MIGTLYEVPNLRGFQADLEQASDEIRRRCEIVTRDTAIRIAVRARALAPKDRGDLRANIVWEGKGLNYRVGINDVSIPSRGGNSAHQNPWVYGVWYEYGFVHRNIKTTPFMRPAADAEVDTHVQRMSEALGNALKVAA
jgi:hypothetical protein